MNTLKEIKHSKAINLNAIDSGIEIRLSYKDIIKALGGSYNLETGNWEIPNTPNLDHCPSTVEFDPCGESITRYVIGINDEGNFEIDYERDDIDLWVELGLPVGAQFHIKGDDRLWTPSHGKITEDGTKMFSIMEFDIDKFATRSQEFKYVPLDELKKIIL